MDREPKYEEKSYGKYRTPSVVFVIVRSFFLFFLFKNSLKGPHFYAGVLSGYDKIVICTTCAFTEVAAFCLVNVIPENVLRIFSTSSYGKE